LSPVITEDTSLPNPIIINQAGPLYNNECRKSTEKAVKDWIESKPVDKESQTDATYHDASTQYLVEDLEKDLQLMATPRREDCVELGKGLLGTLKKFYSKFIDPSSILMEDSSNVNSSILNLARPITDEVGGNPSMMSTSQDSITSEQRMHCKIQESLTMTTSVIANEVPASAGDNMIISNEDVLMTSTEHNTANETLSKNQSHSTTEQDSPQ